MIKTEYYSTRPDGVELLRTYSDEGYYIARDDVIYEEAIDPASEKREYHELNLYKKIPGWVEPQPE